MLCEHSVLQNYLKSISSNGFHKNFFFFKFYALFVNNREVLLTKIMNRWNYFLEHLLDLKIRLEFQ